MSRGQALDRGEDSGTRSDVSGQESDEDGESDGEDDEADASDADVYCGGLDESGVGLCRVLPQAPDPCEDPEVRDRLRRHGMVLMKGRIGCQCKAWKVT